MTKKSKNSSFVPKIFVSFFNFITILWLIFALLNEIEIGSNIKYLQLIISSLISITGTYLIWKQYLYFDKVLEYSVLSWGIGFALGMIFVSIFDPHDGQGVFLSILWTGPIGWLFGISYSIFKAKAEPLKPTT
jgi:hypothetical protein